VSFSRWLRRLIVVQPDDQDEMTHRHIVGGGVSTPASAPPGRKRVAVIGIDHYRNWSPLHNAVRDAEAALRLFRRLGFELVGQTMFDDAATGAAINSFVTDELTALGPDDSLVLFFAGHGGTRTQRLAGKQVKTGYLIPVDAHRDKASTWIDLDDLLRKVAKLPPRHILVFLDACNAGIALSTPRWRGSGTFETKSLAALQTRRSRRIITSALDDQLASDNGPVPGHSLFTGCLIEGFERGDITAGGDVVTGSEVGLYLQHRIRSYPDSHQTPDFGTFDHDDRGEMVFPLPTDQIEQAGPTERPSQTVSLAIATVTTSAEDADARELSRRSRYRWIAAAAASMSILLVSSLAFVSPFEAGTLAIEPPPPRAIAPRGPGIVPASDAAETIDEAIAQVGSDPGTGSAIAAPSTSSSTSAPAAKPGVPRGRKTGLSAPPTGAIASDKRRVRAPSNRRLKSAVDERNCPVKGSQDVTIDSYPPGATLYINHKHCGAIGKTPWDGKLPPSQGTATGTFTVIFERPGEEPATKEFAVLKSTRIQRLELRMP
jgi:uncharacterized caspase-like protein